MYFLHVRHHILPLLEHRFASQVSRSVPGDAKTFPASDFEQSPVGLAGEIAVDLQQVVPFLFPAYHCGFDFVGAGRGSWGIGDEGSRRENRWTEHLTSRYLVAKRQITPGSEHVQDRSHPVNDKQPEHELVIRARRSQMNVHIGEAGH